MTKMSVALSDMMTCLVDIPADYSLLEYWTTEPLDYWNNGYRNCLLCTIDNIVLHLSLPVNLHCPILATSYRLQLWALVVTQKKFPRTAVSWAQVQPYPQPSYMWDQRLTVCVSQTRVICLVSELPFGVTRKSWSYFAACLAVVNLLSDG